QSAPRLPLVLRGKRPGGAIRDTDPKAQPLGELMFEPRLGMTRVAAAGELRMDLDLRERRPPVEDDRVLRRERRVLEDDCLDLAREDVDTPDDQHVVD